MRVILFEFLGFPVRSYGLVVALAILIGIGVTLYFAKQAGKDREQILNLSLYSVIGGLIGARLWEVLFFQPGYYLQNPVDIFAVWKGGMSIQGGLVGGVATAIWYMRRLKWSFWETADLFAPGMILGQAVGRVACFLNGDAYGSPTGSSFGIVYPPGTSAYAEYGAQPLWPAEVWEGQWNLIVFALLLILKNRPLPQGTLFLSYVSLYSAGRFALEFLRGDTPQYLFGWTAAQWTSLAVVIVTGILLLVTRKGVKNHEATA
ncbi:prolipoprotein diacylglyceryl transferase [Effusibacillus lacus]|uniref:Phosphatidylglycerol--prolipoprotein diacylglyceryl transferase n=1 Tax=Effusibacillus lacus TaxID=1348429 RepID=A0A292YT36_9BACL|nr:prolipoprotein diacylglyceryl transferase [Effusibacillus lacus]TCS74976.1 phosphatidylglycerol:prolipoprotein diacylglycerol transferase [Effusibacillus lacus]GAX91645.1 prolipoprotein diacylglyceryl transferase [Effusibacillus lacus]